MTGLTKKAMEPLAAATTIMHKDASKSLCQYLETSAKIFLYRDLDSLGFFFFINLYLISYKLLSRPIKHETIYSMIKKIFILNFFKFYNMLWNLCLPFLQKNHRLNSSFQKQKTSFYYSKADIWIQAASAGEAYLAVNIVKTLNPKKKTKVLITSTTSQGIDILKTKLTGQKRSKFIDITIKWFPFDKPDFIKKTVKRIDPCIMVLLETELWPALLFFLNQNKTKTLIINARLSKKSFIFYLKTKFLWKHLAPDKILATSKQDAKRFQQLFEKATVKIMPNIKFESMRTIAHDTGSLKQIQQILPQALPLTIFASVRKQEEKAVVHILDYILQKFPNQIVAVFPRHMHRIKSWKKHLASHKNFYLKSQIDSALTDPGIILWDVFGELSTAYCFAEVVFVGGSLKPFGGQNFIEPAIQGAVTVTGPCYDDFAWVGDELFQKKIVIRKNNWQSIARTIIYTLNNPAERADRKNLAARYLQSNQGGTKQACNEILKTFD